MLAMVAALVATAALPREPAPLPVAALPPGATDRVVRPGPGPDQVAVVIGEAALGQELNQALAGQPLATLPIGAATVRDITTEVRDGQVRLRGSVGVGVFSLPFEVTASLEARDERAAVQVREASVATFPLPDGARQQLEQALQEQLALQLAEERLRVQQVIAEDGQLTLIGTLP